MAYIRWFHETRAVDNELVGGKAANLGDWYLMRMMLNSPPRERHLTSRH
jgi:phosphoenolpyruvate synthase/pyruvate phosphate dikinase